jgi:hypothetical protein
MIKRALLAIVFLFSFSQVNAQQFGGNPPSVKWKQVNTPAVKVIFSQGLDSTAKRVAAISDYLATSTSASIGTKKRKISMVLQGETTISNGYVQLAPWRSEFFLTPLQNSLRLGSLSWADQLAFHEYRHVQQYMNFRKGLSKFAYFVAGEEGQVLANSAAIPDWFFEGDAVFQETLVSGQGRGRLPSFYNEFRSIWEAKRSYSYMKLRNGSFKHLLPDHYSLGYLLVSYGREKYGDDIWKKVTQDAVAFKPLFYPLQGALKRHTGLKFDDFVDSALSFYKNDPQYSSSDAAVGLTDISERYVKDYSFPQSSHDSLIVLKTTGRDIAAFTLVKNGREKKLFIRDISLDDQFSYRNGKVIYAAYKPDLRWGYRDYSNLRIVELASKKRTWLTKRSKYFAPDLSHNGNLVASVQVENGGRSELHILDASTGKMIQAFPKGAELFYTFPKFSDDDGSVFIPVRKSDGRMSVLKWNLASGNTDTLFPYSYQAIAFPVVRGDTLFFTAGREGQDKLMAWDDRNKQLYEVVDRYAGIQQAAPLANDSIVYAGLSAWGNRLYASKASYRLVDPLAWSSGGKDLYVAKALKTETFIGGLPLKDYPVTKYSKGHGLFNFHSWRPYYDQPDWSFSVYGNNVLNTFNSSLLYLYNENESYHKFEFTGYYSALFPWIFGGVSYTLNRNFLQSNNSKVYWNEWNANAGLRVPLTFTGGRIFSNMYVSSLFNTQRIQFNDGKNQAVLDDLHLNYLDNTVSIALQTQKAVQQIFPRFAFTLFANYRASVTETEARQFLVSSALYLPGVLKNHSVVVAGAFQRRDTANQYLFTNNFPLSRGYPGVNFPVMWKAGVNYHLPLVYPDFGFANIVYFLRVRANMFYDYTNLKSLRTGLSRPLRSAGAEIYFDTRWWNQQPVSFGVRYSRLLDANAFDSPYGGALNPNQWEFVLPINLIPR